MKMQNSINRFLLFMVLFMNAVMLCMAQNIGKIAILSFNGGSQDERDGIAELFSFTPHIMQNFTVIPRTTITKAIATEQSFQLSSGMTDADTMARLGYQFGANYVMAGSITSLGSSKLLIVSIVKIDVIQQVAGAFLLYNSLDNLIKDGTIIGKMAAELVSLMKKDTGKMEKLAVLPVQISGGANEMDGDALAQLLSIYLIRNGKYAVYPRTKTLEQVQKEYTTQLSGNTRDSEAVSLGRGVNPPYVLSIASRRIGNATTFNASVIDLEGGNQVAGVSEPYATINDAINAMDFLAKTLSGVQVSERERSKRSAAVASTADAEEKARQAEERAKQREEAAEIRRAANDNFLRRTGINFGGWLGPSLLSNKNHIGSEDNTSYYFSGGGEIGLRLYTYFDMQVGITSFQNTTVNPLYGPIVTQSIIQSSAFARITLPLGDNYLSPYAGMGINLKSTDDEAIVLSYSQYSFIVGGELGIYLERIQAFAGYQYNRDFSETEYSYGGENFSYLGERHIITFGLRIFMPFRR